MTRLVVVRSWTLPSIEIYLVMNDFSQYEDLAIFHKWKKNRGGGEWHLKICLISRGLTTLDYVTLFDHKWRKKKKQLA